MWWSLWLPKTLRTFATALASTIQLADNYSDQRMVFSRINSILRARLQEKVILCLSAFFVRVYNVCSMYVCFDTLQWNSLWLFKPSRNYMLTRNCSFAQRTSRLRVLFNFAQTPKTQLTMIAGKKHNFFETFLTTIAELNRFESLLRVFPRVVKKQSFFSSHFAELQQLLTAQCEFGAQAFDHRAQLSTVF